MAAKDAGASGAGELPLLTESVTVARGRTVCAGDEKHGPGATFELDVKEAKRLRALGFLVNPTAAEVPTGEGPTFTATDGPKVTAA